MALMRASTTEPAASSQTPLDPSIRITHLSKTFKSRGRAIAALDDLDLTIERGEFVCVVGPSGCGKTTLLNILGGLETASQGSVQLALATGGRPQCSIVFQEQGIFPWMSVLDNAAFGLAARGVARAERERIAHAMLARMGLARFERAYPRELSGGMRQRVNLARAFANDPDLLLMDEPFASLDEQTKLLLQEELLQVWEGSHKTVLFITHSLEEAVRLADRVVIMTARPGRIKAILPIGLPRPRRVLDMPSNSEYLRLHAQLWEYLREEVLATRSADMGGQDA
jgi:NitT/TauT family transport system ATP-binding protein